MRWWMLLGLFACAKAPRETATDDAPPGDSETPDHYVVAGGTVVGLGRVDVVVEQGIITAVGEGLTAPSTIDVSGSWLVPAFIDSHVHLAYAPNAEDLLNGGIAGAVDWAAPEGSIGSDQGGLRMRWSGPMITVPGGYPTQGWGAGGYGLECGTQEEVRLAVGRLIDAGASVIKVPADGALVFEPDVLAALVEEAHARGVKVGAHALSEEGVGRAAAAGVDVLVHMPYEPLPAGTSSAFDGAIPTFGAFGSGPVSAANARALRDAGALILYGTDYGNSRVAGISGAEITGMLAVGFSPEEILAAGTATPAEFFGFDELGAIAPGKAASFLVLQEDPLVEPLTLVRPASVYIDGDLRPWTAYQL